MNIAAPFIARPVATTLLAIAVLLGGILGYLRLPVSSLPEVDFPTIEVSTQLPGASPDTVALLVSAPLERQFAQISGLTAMTAVSGPGVNRITLQFRLDKSMDTASQDVQAALDAARGTLPSTLPYPPTYSKVNPADPAIVTLALTSDTLPIARLSDTADTILAQKLAQVSGVGRVSVQGNMRPAVRLRVDPQRLAAYGIGLETVRTAISNANQNSPKGTLDGARQAASILANDQITTPAEFGDVIIAWKDGAPVRLRDVGTSAEALENDRNGAWFNGRPAILIDVQRQPGANIVETVSRIQALMPELSAAVPAGARLSVVSDRTETIRASVHEVQLTLVLAVALVVGVIYLFLGSGRATLVPAVSLPLSIIGTFGVMAMMGYSLDNLSLMALTIATGFVVDDAIVMIENIVRLIEEGKKPLEAAFEGARQIAFTIVSLTVSLIAVFIPLLFMEGVVGRLFREFAETLTAAVLVSMVISLTLTPMMCALVLRPHSRPGLVARWVEGGFERMRRGYGRMLAVTLRHQGLTLLVALGTVILTGWLYVVIPKGFLPAQDNGLIQITTEAPQDASFARVAALQQRLAEVVRQDPAVASVAVTAGAGATNPAQNTGRIIVVLRPRDERDATAQQVIARLQPRLNAVPGGIAYPVAVQDIQIGARLSTTQYQYTMTDSDAQRLGLWAPRVVDRFRRIPGLRDVASDQRDDGIRIAIQVDRDKASRLGVSMASVANALYDNFGQRQISTIYGQSNQYRVVLEAADPVRSDPNMIGQIRVTGSSTSTGAADSDTTTTTSAEVPLAEIASFARTRAPLLVTREKQFPAVTISFNLEEGMSLGQAVEAIHAAEAEIGLPDTVQGRFGGDVAEFNTSLAGQPWLILAAIIVIYITLGVLYESLIHPVTILSTLPSAGIGALLALELWGLDLSVVGLIGIILLMGIVKKNGIMVIDFALEAQRERGMSPHDAVVEACLLRFRPIMMTTAAALLGALPLVLSSGIGAELRLPLGVSIVGGLLLSQLITLFTTPAVYLAMERLRAMVERWRGAGGTSPAPAE
ncbi:Acriflavin resistance plasma membrane protein [Roseomonas mucosa]|uniref:Acriflavin resistance plasma membrane protein n=1 Tax=Roseomonas mucosa TaxID=207340 RepID=A0A4Y1N309_9PROT|nr:efflux RND transporter permease subunit [Roseomonas mucosa]AWV24561.1 Acriflavin resistance plasma membrane protein [Roseomonas mucosa]MDT8277391.1 efflux RND transporter permease subunit [Roseomonas mucosa]MDT8353911.1 efflux RND transporter permease subunit [Roseomonas mucosa]